MTKRKPQYIRVRCTLPVARDMARYDHATIVEQTLVDDEKHQKWLEWHEKHGHSGDELAHEMEQFDNYIIVLESTQHTIARWHSFCVEPEIVTWPSK